MTVVAAIWQAIKHPWVLLLIACLIGAGGTTWYRMQWLGEVAARTKDLADAQAAVLKAQQQDATRTAALVGRYAAETDTLKEQAHARTIAIATAPNGNGCTASAPMRAALDGLRATAPAAGRRP